MTMHLIGLRQFLKLFEPKPIMYCDNGDYGLVEGTVVELDDIHRALEAHNDLVYSVKGLRDLIYSHPRILKEISKHRSGGNVSHILARSRKVLEHIEQ